MRLIYDLVLIAPVVIGLLRPEARRSWLVRIGGTILVLSFLLLFQAPGLLAYALFYFAAPLGLILIILGTLLSFFVPAWRIRRDVDALVAAARESNRVWPDHPPLREIDRVARHGTSAGPALVARLQADSSDHPADAALAARVEQQLELALCRVYGEAPSGTRTVCDLRATPEDNRNVKPFWEARVRDPRP